MSNKTGSYALALSFALLLLLPGFVRAEGTYEGIGTGDGTDGSNDAINFSQGRVWTIDQYGKYIWLTQTRVNTTTHWAWSNDLGETWEQGSESYTFLTRGSVAYDSINDKLHVIWTATDSNDGIIYRRYGITRDGSNNITAISREDSGNINLQLDTTSSRTLEQAVAYWVNDGSADGILIAAWTKHGSSLNEARASMRKLSLTAADGVAGNWVALDGTGDTFSTDAPAVAADKVYGATNGSSALSLARRGGNGSHKDDLYVFVAEEEDSSADTVNAYRASWNSSNGDWSNGWTSLGSMGAMNTASGYSLKYQLITKPVTDTVNDRLYVGWARWKDGTNGDTVSMSYLNSTDTVSSTIDIYSALASHPYAPTLDIAYDATQDLVYAAYLEGTTNGTNGSIDYKTYNGISLSDSVRFYTSPGGSGGEDGSADIPIVYENRTSNDRILFAFRVNGDLPPTALNKHTINWGYITAPTPTPTPTPSSGSRPLTAAGAPPCTDTIPTVIPYITSAKALSETSVELKFGIGGTPHTLEYGFLPGIYNYAVAGIDGDRFVVGELLPGMKYYFRVAVKNGCTIGAWSNVAEATTKPFFAYAITTKTEEDGPVTETSVQGYTTTPAPSPTTKKITDNPIVGSNPQTDYMKGIMVVSGVTTLGLVLTGTLKRIIRRGWK